MIRNPGRKLLGVALVFAATACDDNVLSENRDEGAYFRLNPSNVAVNAGGTVKVDAVVVNKFGAATNDAVTATPCDAKVSAAADTGRTAYEFPERFVLTGVSLGMSCLIVRGGGLTDTVTVRVVPASINIAGVDTVFSGQTATGNLQFFNEAGQQITGFSLADVTFTNLTAAQGVVDSAGRVTGQAPGTGRFIAALKARYGVTRVDTVTYIVRAGGFTGTVAQSAVVGGQGITFNASTIPFDSDTNISLTAGTETWTCYGNTASTTSRICVLPFNLNAGTPITYAVTNIGPNQVAAIGSITTTTATTGTIDTAEPDNTRATAIRSMVNGETFYGTVSRTDLDDWIRLNIETAGAKTVTVSWNDGSDIDVFVVNATGGAVLTRATAAIPETGSATFAIGTFFININMYEAVSSAPIRYKIVITR